MEEFGFKNAVEYLRGAQKLTGGGEGILTFIRKNGDTLFYNPTTNEFAVLAKDGQTIRSYFKPEEGLEYWLRQTGGH
jgi:filamentous hemagglutinin